MGHDDHQEQRPGGRVVVGVDGSPDSEQALEWAAAAAELRGAVLEIVHAEFARKELLANYRGLERAETAVLEQAEARARQKHPELRVITSLYEPPAAAALVRASSGADLLVVGSRGLGELRGLTMGSVSAECAHRAHCPVAVVRTARSRPARRLGRHETSGV